MSKQGKEMHQEEDVKTSFTDIRNLSAPVLTIVSVIAFFVWITYVGTNERAELRGRLAVIEQSYNRLDTIEKTVLELKDIIRELKTNTKQLGFSESEFALFCLKAQILNKDWKCPNIHNETTPGRIQLNQLNDQDVLQEIDRIKKQETTKQ